MFWIFIDFKISRISATQNPSKIVGAAFRRGSSARQQRLPAERSNSGGGRFTRDPSRTGLQKKTEKKKKKRARRRTRAWPSIRGRRRKRSVEFRNGGESVARSPFFLVRSLYFCSASTPSQRPSNAPNHCQGQVRRRRRDLSPGALAERRQTNLKHARTDVHWFFRNFALIIWFRAVAKRESILRCFFFFIFSVFHFFGK